MNKMIWISVEKENSSFTGGSYPENLVANAIANLREMGYRVLRVEDKTLLKSECENHGIQYFDNLGCKVCSSEFFVKFGTN